MVHNIRLFLTYRLNNIYEVERVFKATVGRIEKRVDLTEGLSPEVGYCFSLVKISTTSTTVKTIRALWAELGIGRWAYLSVQKPEKWRQKNGHEIDAAV